MARHPEPERLTINTRLPDGTPLGQRIIAQLDAGVDPANAAGAAGISWPEYQAWIREGTVIFNRWANGEDWATAFTAYEQDLMLWAREASKAHARHISVLSVISEQVARGGLSKTSTRTKTVNGAVVEVHETVETTLPDPDMLKWRLERLEPAVYGPRATLHVSVVDLTDTPDVKAKYLSRYEALVAARAARELPAGEPVGDG